MNSDLNLTEKKERIAYLTELLDRAARSYEQENREIISNFDYDRLYDELVSLEEETGIVLSNSPTHKAGYEVLSELPKERHEAPMLSLDKTKDRQVLADFAGERESLLSWKMDGLTVVLTYRNGELFKAVTRGNGEIGEVITGNARVFQNIPLSIPYKEELIIRGEAVIRYSDFEAINEAITNPEDRYKNPRNLCSGTVRQLNNRITAERNVYLFPFALISMGGTDGFETRHEQLEFLRELGFSPVEYHIVTGRTMADEISYFEKKISENNFPSDGLVLLYDDIAYGKSLGRTAKFPRDAIAFKWQDETRDTELLYVEWSPSRTGLINPVAVFEPVELEGTTVSRASVHNVSIIEELELGIGDTISVYKANMIIPQIAENKTRSGKLPIPDICPSCLKKTELRSVSGSKSLFCPNPDCPAKQIKFFSHFASRDAMNIEGLSEQTLEKMLDRGWVREPADLFMPERYRDAFVETEGFGVKSYENLAEALSKASLVEMPKLINALGIPNVGLANSKLICREFGLDFDAVRKASEEELTAIPQVGETIAKSFTEYMADPKNAEMLDRLLPHITFRKAEERTESPISGKSFCITGSVTHFPNRDAVKSYIEERGGKVLSAVSKNTDYLINNDTLSNSSKNKKAKELGIPILSEEDFLKLSEG